MASQTPAARPMVVESTSSAINWACNRILPELEANDFGEDAIFAVHLALVEALSNAARHGNKMDPDKKIKIDYLVEPGKFEVFITDQGDGFDPQSVPDPRESENLYKGKGMGLLLMRSYMDVVDFNGSGSCVHMVRYKEKRHKSMPTQQQK